LYSSHRHRSAAHLSECIPERGGPTEHSRMCDYQTKNSSVTDCMFQLRLFHFYDVWEQWIRPWQLEWPKSALTVRCSADKEGTRQSHYLSFVHCAGRCLLLTQGSPAPTTLGKLTPMPRGAVQVCFGKQQNVLLELQTADRSINAHHTQCYVSGTSSACEWC
jgi:hypothetical protein